jgi:gluconate kinase
MILDRCNPTESDRFEWLDKMHSPPRGEVALVYFAADVEICISRVEERTNHETIPQGRGCRIVAEMAETLEPPTPSETKRFGSIHVVHTFDDARELLLSLGDRV